MIHCCPQVLDYIHKHILDEKKGYVMGWPDKFIDAVASASPVWTDGHVVLGLSVGVYLIYC